MKTSLLRLVLILSMAALPQVSAHCQSIDIGITAQFWLSGTNPSTFSIKLDGVTVASADGAADTNNACGPVLSMTTTVTIDTTHQYRLDFPAYGYSPRSLPGGPPSSRSFA